MSDVIKLHQGRPHISSLYDALWNEIVSRAEQQEISHAEIIGTLVMLISDLDASAKEN